METQAHTFDVIVIGAGHAGIEAAYAAARMGCSTLLATLRRDRIGWMPCNPSIGGVGKSHIVHEVAALDGLMPKLCTATYLQSRMLNTRKGPAVQGLRLQIDKFAYQERAQKILESLENLTIVEGEVSSITTDNQQVTGIQLADGTKYQAPTVIVTTGTFMQGLIHVGSANHKGGRYDESPSSNLSSALKNLGLRIGRLKTGTPPRLLKSSINFDDLEKQEADTLPYLFEFYPHTSSNSHSCYIAHTNTQTHEILRSNIKQSPIFGGGIKSRGPRYCPSIEDKITRFADKDSHHVFVEPEGANSEDIYPSGLSTAMPLEIQKRYIHSIKGFENAIITKPGYAVEYDFVYPDQLKATLETKNIAGLFCAGQVNGTTGYEEAAGLGLIAGINAACLAQGKPSFILNRHESYIGVMIDDLITLSVDEPYRMFTSRAERRLILRQDNSFLRLTQKGYDIGVVSQQLYDDFCAERTQFESALAHLRTNNRAEQLSREIGTPTINPEKITELVGHTLSPRVIQNIHAEILYEPYIERELKEIEKAKRYAELELSQDFDYSTVDGISTEIKQKLRKYKPSTIAQAMLIPGITPAAITLLIFKTRRN